MDFIFFMGALMALSVLLGFLLLIVIFSGWCLTSIGCLLNKKDLYQPWDTNRVPHHHIPSLLRRPIVREYAAVSLYSDGTAMCYTLWPSLKMMKRNYKNWSVDVSFYRYVGSHWYQIGGYSPPVVVRANPNILGFPGVSHTVSNAIVSKMNNFTNGTITVDVKPQHPTFAPKCKVCKRTMQNVYGGFFCLHLNCRNIVEEFEPRHRTW